MKTKQKIEVAQVITFQQLASAKQSLSGRISRLRVVRSKYRSLGMHTRTENKTSPIAALAAFEQQINELESIYVDMRVRLDNAKITIEP